MHFFSFILLTSKFIKGMFPSQNEIYDFENVDQKKETIERMPTFELNKREASLYWNAFRKINDYNDRLIQHIRNLKNADNYDGFSSDFLYHLENLIDSVAISRQNAMDNAVCEYEFYKLCEFFYLTLHYIIKNEKNIHFEFFRFLQKTIIPVLKSIKSCLEFCTTALLEFHIKTEKLQKNMKVIPDHIRRLYMFEFCTKYLTRVESDKITTIDEAQSRILENYTLNDFLLLYSNIFTRFYLLKLIKIRQTIDHDFSHPKFPISTRFKDLLYYNAVLAYETTYARAEVNKFLLRNHLHLEKQFVDQKIIPAIYDVINKHSQILKLSRLIEILPSMDGCSR